MFTLHPNEHIILEVRKVWLVFAATAASSFTFALVPVVGFVVADAFAQDFLRGPLLPLWTLIAIGWWLFVWLWFFLALADYYLDVLVVTTERVIYIMQHGLFHREIAELRLSRIQDITTIVNGVLPTMLNFGDLRIETAGETPEFTILQIPHPEQVKNRIVETFRAHLQEERSATLTHHP